MARDWVRLPSYSSKEEAEKYLPDGWQVFQIEQLYEQLPVGKRFEQKTSFPVGSVPVIDQSATGIVGWHNEEPGVLASPENPVVTFANHTCEMRLMEKPFSVIQNVFPMIGKNGVCQTRFLYYLTKGRVWLEEYKGHFPDFRRKWVCCPPLKEQEQLVKILGGLDDKIDLNRRINQTLEAMAQAIFKSWFVDFDPVKAKIAAKQEGRDPLRAAMSAISGKPDAELDALPPEHYAQLAATAALFPDEMQDSELGEIPRGWKTGSLSDFASFQNGYAFKTKDWTGSGHPVVKIGNVKPGIIDVSGCSFVAHETVNGLDRFALKRGDLVIGMTGYVGETGLVPELNSVAYLNQRVGRLSTVNGVSDIGYPFCLVRDPAYKAYAESKAHGSAQANVSGKDLMDYQAVVPAIGVLNIFNAQVEKIIREDLI
ncbi:restriction endonuclease subunit S [Candidatus Igneacidithiobacillus taiwanensis]|uniref:restriction endonuclease subunit S n=2 Tax=Candidatus Igneacidithiobacillus taiwanensis TaxID=1945924 RepID=UPI00289BA8B2|nr:restriction endonuclease subunit S [Candidatus Igneacidithiobacillus taiwanensis]